jgi:hypothetical protein
MADALLHPELAACGLLGLGGVLLGLAAFVRGGAFLRSRRTLAGPAALLVVTAVCVGLGQPPRVWLAPLGLAALWALGHVALSPLLDQVGAALALLRRPRGLGTALLAVSAVLTVAMLRGSGKPLSADAAGDLLDWVIPTEQYGLRAVQGKQVVTDRGRPVRLVARTRPAPVTPDLLAREAAVLRPHLLAAGLVRLAPPSADCNCHGWIFLDGRYWLPASDMNLILEDNGYEPVKTPRVGDLVVYRADDGEIAHSGVVLALEEGGAPLVQSKWADLGYYVHRAELRLFGRHQFFHSPRTGHVLAGVQERAAAAAPSGVVSRTH